MPMDAARMPEQIVENTRDAVLVADTDGVIRLWNPGAVAMFGFTAAEALGQSLDLIVPERPRERHWEGYRKVMATGETRYAEELLAVPAMRKDGSRISIEFTVTLLKDGDGKVEGIAAIARDVTARRQQETAQRERIAELEARVAELSGQG